MKEGMKKLLSARDLLKVVASQSFSVLANQVVAFVIPWIVLAQTGNAFYAGVVAFAAGIAHFVGALLERLTVSASRLSSYVNNILNASKFDRRHLKLHLTERKLQNIF